MYCILVSVLISTFTTGPSYSLSVIRKIQFLFIFLISLYYILFQECQKKLWGACLFVTVTDMDVACFTLTQVLKAVSLK